MWLTIYTCNIGSPCSIALHSKLAALCGHASKFSCLHCPPSWRLELNVMKGCSRLSGTRGCVWIEHWERSASLVACWGGAAYCLVATLVTEVPVPASSARLWKRLPGYYSLLAWTNNHQSNHCLPLLPFSWIQYHGPKTRFLFQLSIYQIFGPSTYKGKRVLIRIFMVLCFIRLSEYYTNINKHLFLLLLTY